MTAATIAERIRLAMQPDQYSRWVTVGGTAADGKKHVGGTPVKISDDGTVEAGPKAMKGQSLGKASQSESPPQHANSKAPWHQTADEFAASGAKAFHTSQGSLYVHNNGQTIRVKTPHIGHDPNDVGLKQGSVATHFVSPQDAQRVGMWNTMSGQGKRIIVKDGHMLLTSLNPATGQRGLDERIPIVSSDPQVGLAPIELLSKSSQGDGWYSGNHPGNTISQMVDPREAHKHLVSAAKHAGKTSPAILDGSERTGLAATTTPQGNIQFTPKRYSLPPEAEQYARHKSAAGQQEFRWITIGGESDGDKKHAGGTHVQIKSSTGEIVAGPDALTGKKVGELGKPEAKKTEPKSNEKPARKSGYFKGDRIEYTGKMVDGFHEFEYMEGHKKGETGVTATAPDGSHPRDGKFQEEWKQQQEEFGRLHKKENSDQQRDTAVANVPLDKRGGGSLDSQIDKWKRDQAAEAKAKRSENAQKNRDDKAAARELFDSPVGDRLIKSTAEKTGKSEKEVRHTLDQMVKWQSGDARKLLESAKANQEKQDQEQSTGKHSFNEKLKTLHGLIVQKYRESGDPNPEFAADSAIEGFMNSTIRGQEQHKDQLIDEEIEDYKKAAMKRNAAKPEPMEITAPDSIATITRTDQDGTKTVEQAKKPDEVQKPVAAAAEPEAAPKTGLSKYADHESKIRKGEATADEIRQWFREATTPEAVEALRAELSKKSVAELKEMGAGGYHASGMKKADLVDDMIDKIQSQYHVGGSISYNPMAPGGYMQAVAKAIEKQTDDDVKAYADRVAKATAERKERMEKIIKAIKDPQTLEDFKLRDQFAKDKTMTPEMQARYDELVGTTRREKEAAEAAKVQGVTGVSGLTAEIKEGFHAKKQKPTYVAVINQRVERDKYNELLGAAKKLGGYYSSFKGAGAIPGFQFDTKEAADKFKDIVHGKSVDRSEILEQRQEAKAESRADTLRERAETIAESAQENIDRDRKTNTHRRAEMAARIESRERQRVAHAETMKKIADGMESGTLKHLSGVRAATHVEQLHKSLKHAQYKAIRNAEAQNKNMSYNEREALWASEPSAEDITHAEYPYPRVWANNLRSDIDAVAKVPGLKNAARTLSKLVGGQSDRVIALENEKHIDALSQIASKLKGHSNRDLRRIGQSAAGELEDFNRMQSMGIKSLPELRAALREFHGLREAKQKEDPIKVAERKLIGRKIEGFFPTPRSIINQMMEAADIQPGMSVLEPSAGKGDILDAVREVHGDNVTTDAIEPVHELRELLSMKGHSVGGHDFLEHKGQHDRILMNPPFEGGKDIQHVRHAFDQLAPGGRLVAIVTNGGGKKREEFDQWVESNGGYIEPLPERAFAGADAFRQTGVNTRMVVIDKASTEKYSLADQVRDAANEVIERYQYQQFCRSFEPVRYTAPPEAMFYAKQLGFNWDEQKHPRDAGGLFAKKGEGESGAKSEPAKTAKPEPSAAHKAVASRFGIPPEAVQDIASTDVKELRRRDEYTPPNYAGDGPVTDFEDHPLGTARIMSFGDPNEAYVDFMHEFDPKELTPTEHEDGIKQRDKSYPKYVEWAKAGHKPPPISAAVSEKTGKYLSMNRRRVLAAQDAGVKSIKGWLGVNNKETGNPLKYGDVMRALKEHEQKADEKPAAPPAKAKPPGVAGMQQGLFGQDQQTGQKSLFNVSKPAAKKPAAKEIAAKITGRLGELLAGKDTVSPADLTIPIQSESLPGQKSMFSMAGAERYEKRWITLGKDGQEHRTRVQIDDDGRITAGPAALKGDNISSLGDKSKTAERRVKADHAKAAGKTGRDVTTKQAVSLGLANKVQQHQHAAKHAKLAGVSTADVLKLMPEAQQFLAEQSELRERAKDRARKLTGMNAGTLAQIENSHRDYSTVPGFDEAANAVAMEHPELGLDPDDSDTPAAVWDLIREGKQDSPVLHSPEVAKLAADWLKASKSGKKQAKPVDDDDSVPFSMSEADSEKVRLNLQSSVDDTREPR